MSVQPKGPRRRGDLGFTPKQEKFCQLWATHAHELTLGAIVRNSGYRAKGATATGCELLNNPKIIARIKEINKEREYRTQVTADRTVMELARIAYSNISTFKRSGKTATNLKEFLDGLDDNDLACVEAITEDTLIRKGGGKRTRIRYKMWSKTEALKMLGTVQGLFLKRVKIETDEPAGNIDIDGLKIPLELRKTLRNAIREKREEMKKKEQAKQQAQGI